jgi:allophanate hydrolase subunit 2
LSNVRSTATIKQPQITLSPKYKDYYNKRRGTNLIDVESPVDNITAASGASNTLNKVNKQPIVAAFKNTQGLQGSIYNASNSTDVRTKIEREQSNQIKEQDENDLEYDPSQNVKRAMTQSNTVRINKGSVNRIREAKMKAEMLINSQGNNQIFQYQFELQNQEEETCFKNLYDCLSDLLD